MKNPAMAAITASISVRIRAVRRSEPPQQHLRCPDRPASRRSARTTAGPPTAAPDPGVRPVDHQHGVVGQQQVVGAQVLVEQRRPGPPTRRSPPASPASRCCRRVQTSRRSMAARSAAASAQPLPLSRTRSPASPSQSAAIGDGVRRSARASSATITRSSSSGRHGTAGWRPSMSSNARTNQSSGPRSIVQCRRGTACQRASQRRPGLRGGGGPAPGGWPLDGRPYEDPASVRQPAGERRHLAKIRRAGCPRPRPVSPSSVDLRAQVRGQRPVRHAGAGGRRRGASRSDMARTLPARRGSAPCDHAAMPAIEVVPATPDRWTTWSPSWER